MLLSLTAAAQQPPPQSKTVADSINYIWKWEVHDFTALADAMPEDKWSFKPTQGAFTDVRTFAEQVKHVACANFAFANKVLGEKPPAHCDKGGPDPAKTKAEIMKYLADSIAKMDQAISSTNEKNMLDPRKGPYAGDNPLSILATAVWHISDHYGQLVEYLRMNGIVPPASR
jgi:uncharacterized damage-inducible protein DinB